MLGPVTVESIPEQTFLFIRDRVKLEDIGSRLAVLFGEVFAYVHEAHVIPAGQPCCRYFREADGSFTIEAGGPVASSVPGKGRIECATLSPCTAAAAIYSGPYDGLTAAHVEFRQRCAETGFALADHCWETYLTDPGQEPDPSRWQTRIVYPLREPESTVG